MTKESNFRYAKEAFVHAAMKGGLYMQMEAAIAEYNFIKSIEEKYGEEKLNRIHLVEKLMTYSEEKLKRLRILDDLMNCKEEEFIKFESQLR